jgi:hypothetical protein
MAYSPRVLTFVRRRSAATDFLPTIDPTISAQQREALIAEIHLIATERPAILPLVRQVIDSFARPIHEALEGEAVAVKTVVRESQRR